MTHLLLLAVLPAADPVPQSPLAAPVKIFTSPTGVYGLRIVPKEKVIGRDDGGWPVVGWAGEATFFTLDRHGKEMPGWTAPTTFPDRALVSEDGTYVVAITSGGAERVEGVRAIYRRMPSVVIYGMAGKEVAAFKPEDLLTKEDRAGQKAWTDGVEFRLNEKAKAVVVTTPAKQVVKIDLATGAGPERK